jgi:diacylglycerol O-acyltransferase / wax synthase
VPGPPVPLYFLGARIEEVLPIIGPGGNVTLMLSAFSYCDRLNLLLDVRASAYPDMDVLVGGMKRSWEQLVGKQGTMAVTALSGAGGERPTSS